MPMRDMVPPPNASTDPERNVPEAVWERLSALTSKWGWECMVTISDDDPAVYVTLNPFNKNPDGTIRDERDIRLALAAKIAAWQAEPEAHTKCDGASRYCGVPS